MPAGTWRLVADGRITMPVDVTFEILWRRPGVEDVEIVRWAQHFDPPPGEVGGVVPFDVTGEGEAIDWEPGDQLIFRYTGEGDPMYEMAYVPNTDDMLPETPMPHIDLPR